MRALGPGLLESVYRRCLMVELGLRGLEVYAEYPIPVRTKEVVLDCGYRADLLARISHKVSTAEAQMAMSTAYPIYALLKLGALTSGSSTYA